MDGRAPTNTGAQAVRRGPKTAGAHPWRIMRRNWLTTQKGLPMIKVAILFGGISTEHDVSCKSADNVIRALAGRFELTLIGITTFVFSAAGLKVGNLFGTRYKAKAELTGGIILILIGLKILLEHLGVINF